jgi:hypothetical protein
MNRDVDCHKTQSPLCTYFSVPVGKASHKHRSAPSAQDGAERHLVPDYSYYCYKTLTNIITCGQIVYGIEKVHFCEMFVANESNEMPKEIGNWKQWRKDESIPACLLSAY